MIAKSSKRLILSRSKRLILSGVLLIVAVVLSVFEMFDATLPTVAAALVFAYYCFKAPNSKIAYIAGFASYALSGILEQLIYVCVILGVTLEDFGWFFDWYTGMRFILPGIVQFIACGLMVVIKFRWNEKIGTAATVAFVLYIAVSVLQGGVWGIMQSLALFNIWLLEGGTPKLQELLQNLRQEKPAAAKPGTATEQIVLENELASLKQQYENQTITEEEYNRRRKELLSKF